MRDDKVHPSEKPGTSTRKLDTYLEDTHTSDSDKDLIRQQRTKTRKTEVSSSSSSPGKDLVINPIRQQQRRPFTSDDENVMLNYLIRTNSIPKALNIATWQQLENDDRLFPHRMGPLFVHFISKMLPKHATYNNIPKYAYRQLLELRLLQLGYPLLSKGFRDVAALRYMNSDINYSSLPSEVREILNELASQIEAPLELTSSISQGTEENSPDLKEESSDTEENSQVANEKSPSGEERSLRDGENPPGVGDLSSNEETQFPKLDRSIRRREDSPPVGSVVSPVTIDSRQLTSESTFAKETILEPPEKRLKGLNDRVLNPKLSRLETIQTEKSFINSDESLLKKTCATASSCPKRYLKAGRRRPSLVTSSDSEEFSGKWSEKLQSGNKSRESSGSSPATRKTSHECLIIIDSSSSEASPVSNGKTKRNNSRVPSSPLTSPKRHLLEISSSSEDERVSRARKNPEKNSMTIGVPPVLETKTISVTSPGNRRGRPIQLKSRNLQNMKSQNSENDRKREVVERNTRSDPDTSTSSGDRDHGFQKEKRKEARRAGFDEDGEHERKRARAGGLTGTVPAVVRVGGSEENEKSREKTVHNNQQRNGARAPARVNKARPLTVDTIRRPFSQQEDQAMVDALVEHDLIYRATALRAWEELLAIGIPGIANRTAKSLMNHFSNYLRWNYEEFTDDPEVRAAFVDAEKQREYRHSQRKATAERKKGCN